MRAAGREELWRIVTSLVVSEQERVVLVESYVFDLPPRAILARHPGLFADVPSVYSAKRNLLNRLQRSRELQRLREEQFVA
jgi:hypothetical protein